MIEKLTELIKEHPECVLIELDNSYAVSSIQDYLPQRVKDFINCHFKVLFEDQFYVEFIDK